MKSKLTKPKVEVTVGFSSATCYMFSDIALRCFVCGFDVPPNTHHECELNGGVKTVRNRPKC